MFKPKSDRHARRRNTPVRSLLERLELRRLLAASITELSTPMYDSLNAVAINNKGQVLLQNEDGASLLYTGGAYQLIQSPGVSQLNARGLSDSGEIVGYYSTSGNRQEAFSLVGSTFTTLGDLGGTFGSFATAVNNKGQIVGTSSLPGSGSSRPFLYTDGKLTNIGLLPGASSGVATDINSRGEVIGYDSVPTGLEPFLYSGGKLVGLGRLPGGASALVAHTINDSGLIAGDGNVANSNNVHLFTSQDGAALKDLGSPVADGSVAALSINNHGDIAGYFQARAANASMPFLYTGGNFVLPGSFLGADSGWAVETNTGVNDSDQIIGQGIHNGKPEAYLADLPSAAPAGVTGTVYHDANGNGKQDTGETGVEGVSVTLKAGDVVYTATTNANGLYAIQNVDASQGSYALSITTPTGDKQTTPAGSVTVTPTAGQTVSGENFGLTVPATTSSVSGTVYVDTNGDGKQDNGETGLKGVTVSISLEALASGVNTPAAATATTATTDASGHYTFSGLTAGEYAVSDTVPGGYSQTAPASGKYDVLVGLNGPQTVTGEDFGVKLKTVVPTTVTVSGTVYNDANADGSDDNGETGLKGVTVTLTLSAAANGASVPAATVTTTTDANGAYAFTGVALNHFYDISVTPPAGYKQINPTGKITILAADSAAYPNEDFGLNKPVVVPPATASVSGTVFSDANDDGKKTIGETGLAGVTIMLTPAAVAGNVNSAAAAIAKITDASGNYSFTGLAAGTYLVTATPPAGYTQTLPNSGGYTVTLAAGQAVTGELFGEFKKVVVPPTTASVAGTVFNDANDNGKKDAGETGLANVSVTLAPALVTNLKPAAAVTVLTDSSGAYSFTGLAAGTYTVSEAVLSGYTQTTPSTGTFTVTLAASQAVTGELFGQFKPTVIPPATGTISGLLFNDDNGNGKIDKSDGPTGVRTVFLDTNGNGKLDAGERSVRSAANGTYTFTNVAPGQYKVSRLFPVGYHLSDPTSGTGGNDVLVSVAAGGAAAANLGTYHYLRSAGAAVDGLATAIPATNDLLAGAGLD